MSDQETTKPQSASPVKSKIRIASTFSSIKGGAKSKLSGRDKSMKKIWYILISPSSMNV